MRDPAHDEPSRELTTAGAAEDAEPVVRDEPTGRRPRTLDPAVTRMPTAADRPLPWRRVGHFALLAPAGWLLQLLGSCFPAVTERLYARGIYPWIEGALVTIVRPLPFALGECALLLACAFGLGRLVAGVVAVCRRRRSIRNLLAHALGQCAIAFGILFLAFVLLWGLNHARQPFATQVGLHPQPAEVARLQQAVQELAGRAAAVRPSDLDPIAGPPGFDFRAAVVAAYAKAGHQLAALDGPAPVIRTPWIARLMTFASVTGIYSPYTGEANVNDDVPAVLLPFIACHEVAHLRGYAREDEANFIAWWVGSRSDDPMVRYSCELNAWRIALGELAAVDFMAYAAARDAGAAELRADDLAIRRFWNSRPQTITRVLTEITTTTNDLYLRSSGHHEGVHSYGRMVDLLIAALVD